MKEIPLTQGKVAVVDNEDYEFLMQWKWCAQKNSNSDTLFYALTRTIKALKRTTMRMHRLIAKRMGIPEKYKIDHKDGTGLNNVRSNLRIGNGTQNAANRKKQKNNTSGYRGVYWYKPSKKWQVRLRFNKRLLHFGYFTNKKIAARVYDTAATKYFGAFARLNFPR